MVLPQVGQGALAVECRADDGETRARLAGIEHEPSRVALDAERAWLAAVGGGCDVPVGALATVASAGTVRLDAVIASRDGRIMLRDFAEGDDAVAVGRELARRMVDDGGGRVVLELISS